MNDPQAQPEPNSRKRQEQAILRLAEAEAQVERTIKAERNHLYEVQERLRQDDEDASLLERVAGKPLDFDDYDTLRMVAQYSDDKYLTGLTRVLARSSPTRPAALRKTMKVLTRYRREAESARRRAFANWLEAG